MNKGLKYILIIVLIGMLFLIRAFEGDLFYDPLIEYFQNDYLYASMPELNIGKLIIDILFRYVLNSFITLGIIYVAFNKKSYVKFAGSFLFIAFLILLVIFVFLLKDEFRDNYLLPFYIRRFLIHPLFLLVLFPSFYYMKLNNLKKF